MRSLFLLSLLVAGAFALSPSHQAVKELARNLQEVWGENRLNSSIAEQAAFEQLQWIIDHRNETTTTQFREPEPMLADCPQLAPRQIPKKVTELHPQDVRIIAALGDSVSTGCNSLSSSWLNMKDFQGISWCIGGDSGVTTLPNILAQFTSVTGPAKGVGNGNTGFNFAKNGAIVQDTPGQAKALVSALKSNSKVDYSNDWKVVTILMGGNNLCEVCNADKEQDNNAATFEKYIRETLTILSEVPRTFVNLVSHLDYTQIAKYKGPFCGAVLPYVCDCLTSTDAAKQKRARQEIEAYNAVIEKIAPSFKRDDFAVVVQPSLIKSIIPDDSYISNADCFHPSGEGQRMFATALWNSMILPASQKASYTATVKDLPKCPDSNTRLYV